jgi:hypothetical protein
MIDDRGVVGAMLPRAGAVDLQHVSQNLIGMLAGGQVAQLPSVGFVDRVIGVHPEEPVALGVAERLVAGGREIIAPGELEEPRPVVPGDFFCRVERPGIDDDQFVDPGADTGEAGRQRAGRIADDHAEGKPGTGSVREVCSHNPRAVKRRFVG